RQAARPRARPASRGGGPGAALTKDETDPIRSLPPREDFDPARSRFRRDAVLDGVFDQGLQDEVGHQRVLDAGLELEARREAILKPRLLDLEVHAQKLQLF